MSFFVKTHPQYLPISFLGYFLQRLGWIHGNGVLDGLQEFIVMMMIRIGIGRLQIQSQLLCQPLLYLCFFVSYTDSPRCGTAGTMLDRRRIVDFNLCSLQGINDILIFVKQWLQQVHGRCRYYNDGMPFLVMFLHELHHFRIQLGSQHDFVQLLSVILQRLKSHPSIYQRNVDPIDSIATQKPPFVQWTAHKGKNTKLAKQDVLSSLP
mmetsp:Transcript_13421/g.25254  ORF Transcript_13421/g.25254 Transcript_13421/m.25254 type:complete len:208 (-) Transcript_13421:41-664(-)